VRNPCGKESPDIQKEIGLEPINQTYHDIENNTKVENNQTNITMYNINYTIIHQI